MSKTENFGNLVRYLVQYTLLSAGYAIIMILMINFIHLKVNTDCCC